MTFSPLTRGRMRPALYAASLVVCVAASFFPFAVQAGAGHDHGEETPAASGPALPRFAATSEMFELVGVLNGKHLTLYLDHAATNAPVKDARLEIEFGTEKLKVEPHAEGEFEATLAQEPEAGVIPIAATVVAGNDADLLAGELDLHDDHAEEEDHAHDWKEYALWGVGGLLVLVLAALGIRRISRLNNRSGGAA
ncbi:MAG TPA: hypothetical protein VM406_14845 [Noviherbaspirillum sp.]|nr:hypothetical protein [Noviherbaspirillum sp.]